MRRLVPVSLLLLTAGRPLFAQAPPPPTLPSSFFTAGGRDGMIRGLGNGPPPPGPSTPGVGGFRPAALTPAAPASTPFVNPAPAVAPAASTPPAAQPTPLALPAPEHLITFNPDMADLNWTGRDWQLAAGGVLLKNFGPREREAREALRLVRELRLSQYAPVGGPPPVLEYWLADGKAPSALSPGLHTVPLHPADIAVEQQDGQWCLNDGRRALFNFGRDEDGARQALAVIQKYGFAQVAVVGQGAPAMLVFLTAASDVPAGAEPHVRVRPVSVPHDPPAGPITSHPAPGMPGAAPAAPAGAPGAQPAAAPPAPQVMQAPVVPAIPALRPTGAVVSPAAPLDDLAERTPFDWRQVQLRQDGKDWRLTAGGLVLADFGTDERAARIGLSAMQYYHFTERCVVGGDGGRLSYFLVNGQAPHGVLFGVDNRPFQPDRLEAKQVEGRWAVCEGDAPLLKFGAKPDEAKRAVEAIRRGGFDRLCRLGADGDKGMTFLVRTR
jgi:hypothetical protein